MKRLVNFFKSVGDEMKEVDWPNRRQLRHDYSAVVSISLFFIAFFAVVDWVLQLFISLFV